MAMRRVLGMVLLPAWVLIALASVPVGGSNAVHPPTQPEDQDHRALRDHKKGGTKAHSEAFFPDGHLFPGTAAAGQAYNSPFGVGPSAVGIGAVPGLGLAPAVQPGISRGVHRNRDAIDALNRKAQKSSHHALCSNFRMTPPLSFPAAGAGPTAIQIGDLNGDCVKDFVVADSASDVVAVFLGCGDGTYFPGVRYPVGPPGSFPYRFHLADVNGDKRLDIVTANLGGSTLSVLLGRGDGTFTNGFVFPTGGGGGPVDLALGDFNGDGILDIALALAKCDTLAVLWGDGRGSFVRPIKISLALLHAGTPLSILAVDLNLDGCADLVVGLSCAEKNLAVLTSLGDGTFRKPVFYDLGKHTKPVAMAVGLFNCDLFPDVAVVNGALANTVSVLLGRGDGTFFHPQSYSVAPGLAPMALAVGDLNGDLHCDIVTANSLSNDVTVLRGTCFWVLGFGERNVRMLTLLLI